MDTLILNFFYDGICRLIPGIVVICLYGINFVTHAQKVLKGLSVFLAVYIFLIAWLIGTTLDTFTFAPSYDNQRIRNVLFPTNQLAKMNTQMAKDLANANETEPQKFVRMQKVRMQAEVVLFRVMMCISIFSILLPPKIFSTVWPSTTSSDCQWLLRFIKHVRPRFLGFLGTEVFYLCWWYGRILV